MIAFSNYSEGQKVEGCLQVVFISAPTYILNVELEVLGITERGLHGLDSEILSSFVGETHQEPHNFIGRKLCSYHGNK